MDSVQAVKEFSQRAGSMWPDDECVVYVAKAAEGVMGRRLQSHFFKVLHKIVCNEWGKRRTHRHIVDLLVELANEAEKGGRQYMTEKSQDRVIKVPRRRLRTSSMSIMVKRETTSKLTRMSRGPARRV
jgi:hypothetical protein